MIDIERSPEPPPSLARGSDWGAEDVRVALHRDFLGKCYLCESLQSEGSFEVDHRRPRRDPAGAGLEFEWSNLFPACDFCNGRRPKRWPEGGMLSPGASEELERRIVQFADPLSSIDRVECRFSARDPDDLAAANTAAELQHIHSVEPHSSFRVRVRTRELLVSIRIRIAEAICAESQLRELEARRASGASVAEGDLRDAREAFERCVSRREPFTMLVRSIVGDEFEHLFD